MAGQAHNRKVGGWPKDAAKCPRHGASCHVLSQAGLRHDSDATPTRRETRLTAGNTGENVASRRGATAGESPRACNRLGGILCPMTARPVPWMGTRGWFNSGSASAGRKSRVTVSCGQCHWQLSHGASASGSGGVPDFQCDSECRRSATATVSRPHWHWQALARASPLQVAAPQAFRVTGKLARHHARRG